MAVQENIRPDYTQKTLQGLKADRTVVRLTFNKSEAKENETLQVTILKLYKNELIKPNSFKLLADVDLSEGDENNFLVDNFGRAVVSMLTVKFGGQLLNQIMGYDIYKIYEDLYLPRMKRSNMIEQGVQSVDLNKIRSNSAVKKTSGVDTENKLNAVYGSKYCIPIDHPILSQNGAFYPHFLRDELLFEITLAQAAHVVKGPDQSKLTYTLKNIQLQYEIIKSRELAEIAEYEYESGKEFIFDHIDRFKNEEFDLSDKGLLNFSVNVMKNSLKAVLLLFIKPTNCGKSLFLLDQLYGPFRHKFENIALICPTFAHNSTYFRLGINDPQMYIVICEQHEVEKWLRIVSLFFSGTRSLIILDDCASSKDLKGRSGHLVNLAFSARHLGISVWILAQKITSISSSFRENVAYAVLFYSPSSKTNKTIFDEFAGELSKESFNKILGELKTKKHSFAVFSQRYPFSIQTN